MLPNDGKVDSNREKLFVTSTEEANRPLIIKETLPAPINQSAIDRIFQESILQRPGFKHWTDKWDTTFSGSATTSVSSTTLDFDWDYYDSRNYLSTNQFNDKNTAITSATPMFESCGNSCGELSEYSDNFSGMKTETSWPMEYKELGKPEQEDKENYYDEVEDEHRTPIAFSRHSSLKKHLSTFMDTIPAKPFQKITSVKHETQDDIEPFAANSNLQNANVVKSKSELHIITNNRRNQKGEDSEKHHGHSKIIGPFKKLIFRSPNHNSLPTNPAMKESKNTGQSNIAVLSFLKFKKRPKNERTEFLLKSNKSMGAQTLQNNDEQLNSLVPMKKSRKDGFLKRRNFILKFSNKQKNMSTQTAHRSLKSQQKMMNNTVKNATNGLQFSYMRKKPKRKKLTNRFAYYIQKPEIGDAQGKNLVLELQRDIWTNIVNISREESFRKKNKLLPEVLTTPIQVESTVFNPSIEHRILVKKIRLKRPIRTRNAKLFYSIKPGEMPILEVS
ncbi:hypothetical protein LOAG_03742 [Loa loa]|nr:hypothetical protein LOAG_03742 [Loa loa]EFO24738.2 hypothetical protein LOAG_03742 [Loa loa]